MSSNTRNVTNWSEGYCVDLPYTMGAYKQISPISLTTIAQLKGRSAPCLDSSFNYLELGCGNGVSVVANAAMYPNAHFYAVDFNPEHVSFARELANEAGLKNIDVYEMSFEEIATAPKKIFPDCDIITFHGILSWISAENREHLLNIVHQYLKNGGLVYGSYNCQPGWGALLPVRQLLLQYAARHPEMRPDQQAFNGLKYVLQLLENGAVSNHMFPQVKPMIEKLLKMNQTAYLAHEWMNRDLYAPYSQQMIEQFESVKCSFIGKADAADNVESLSVPAALRDKIEEKDGTARETAVDFAVGRKFRQDIYGRGVGIMTGTQKQQFAQKAFFAQHNELPDPNNIKINTSVGEATGDAKVFSPIIDALKAGDVTLTSLRANPNAHPNSKTPWLCEIILLAWHHGMLAPVSPQAARAQASCQAFNKVICQRNDAGDGRLRTFVMPKFGTPVMVSDIDVRITTILLKNPQFAFAQTVKQFIADTLATGVSFAQNGKSVQGEEAEVVATNLVRQYYEGTARLLQRGGVLPSKVSLTYPAAPSAPATEEAAA